jgi:citrate lyase subunit beta/citryl-CoA lyase
VLNRVFSPSHEEVRYAKQVVKVFEQAEREGRSSCSLKGKMIDPPIYQRAVYLLERDRIIQSRKVINL